MAVLQKKNLFVGYSTLGKYGSKRQQYADIALIKRDLIANFYTRPGERLMLPNYGWGGWNLLFDPFDEVTQEALVYQTQQVIANDSRLQLKNINVIQIDQGVLIQLEILYIPFNVIETFTMTFNNTQIM
jgi:phage baseplate assembly protein W